MMEKPKTGLEASKRKEEEVLGVKRKVTGRRLSQIVVLLKPAPLFADTETTVGKGSSTPLPEECLTYSSRGNRPILSGVASSWLALVYDNPDPRSKQEESLWIIPPSREAARQKKKCLAEYLQLLSRRSRLKLPDEKQAQPSKSAKIFCGMFARRLSTEETNEVVKQMKFHRPFRADGKHLL